MHDNYCNKRHDDNQDKNDIDTPKILKPEYKDWISRVRTPIPQINIVVKSNSTIVPHISRTKASNESF